MKNIQPNWRSALIGAALITAALAGCDALSGGDGSSSGKPSAAELKISASSTSNPTALRNPDGSGQALTLPAGVTVTNFLIALEDIEFEREDENMDDETDEPEFEGPFFVDMLDSTGILAQSLGAIEIPSGTYEGIEFDMHKGSADDAGLPPELLDRSLYLAGSWMDGATSRDFQIWHDATEEFFITGPNGITVDAGATGNSLIVEFNIDNILFGIDFSTAVFDSNGHFLGDFSISPDSTQPANRDLAEAIKNNLEAAAEFGEDQDGDGDLGDNEDTEDDGDTDADGIDDDDEDETEDDDGIGDAA